MSADLKALRTAFDRYYSFSDEKTFQFQFVKQMKMVETFQFVSVTF